MRLNRIVLAGFKSFADRVEIPMDGRCIAIVGPNGCGKSNVVDAIRWVLGESAARHLRGSALGDVIFNGSSQRRGATRAYVELHFSQCANRLSGRYSTIDDLVLRREIHANGDSIFSFNQNRCRKADIVEMMAGTGLGSRSYAVIGQGTVGRLVEAKPEELRLLLEDAAGMAHYRQQRKETETRLQESLNNLDQMEASQKDLQRRGKRLQEQKNRAFKYENLRTELRDAQMALTVLYWRRGQEALALSGSKIQDIEQGVETRQNKENHLEQQIQALRSHVDDAGEMCTERQSVVGELNGQISRAEQRLDDLKRQHQAMRVRRETLQSQERDQAREYQLQQQQIAEIENRLEQANAMHEDSGKRCLQSKKILEARQSAETRRVEEEKELLEQRGLLKEQITKRAVQIESDEAMLEHIQHQYFRGIADEQQAVDVLARRMRDMQDEIDFSRDAVAEFEIRCEQCAVLRCRLESVTNYGDDWMSAFQQRQLRLQTQVESIAHSHADSSSIQNQDAMNPWLEKSGLGMVPRLIDLLVIEPGWESAIEEILGSWMYARVVEGTNRLELIPAELEGSGLMIMQADRVEAVSHPATLSAKIIAPLWAQKLVASFHAAEDHNGVMDVGHAQSHVNPSGFLWGQGQFRAPLGGDQGGVLRAMTRLRQWRQELEQLNAVLPLLLERQSKLRSDCQALVKESDELDAELVEARRDLDHALLEHQHVVSRHDEAMLRLESRKDAMMDLDEQREAIQERLGKYRNELGELEQSLPKVDNRMNHLRQDPQSQSYDEARRVYESERGQVQQNALVIEQIKGQYLTAVERGNHLEKSLDSNREQLLQSKERLEHLDAVDPLQASLDVWRAQQERDKLRLNELQQQYHGQRTDLRELETELEQIRKQLFQDQEHLQHWRLQQQNASNDIKQAEHQKETLDLPEEQFAAHPCVSDSEDRLRQRIATLQKQLDQFGAVNLNAEAEYQELEQQHGYLLQQLEDVHEATQMIRQAMERIDAESRQRLNALLSQLERSLAQHFSDLFDGGTAELKATSDDLWTSGILLNVRPPGKPHASIHSLSGGEKALAALALVLGLFDLNPAPFCLFDEVDAPLDDPNTLRFSRLLTRISDRIQCLVISHNKLTMATADRLIGVTMQEPGVSRIVSVDLENIAHEEEMVS